MKILLAGATGAIGRRLVPLLVEAHHHVIGTTRSADKVGALQAAGAEPAVVDVFDGPALAGLLADVRPELVIHQLTDLPPGLDPARMAEAGPRNAHLRKAGTRNLIDAARAAGVRRVVVQSIAWIYAAGPEPHAETDPLDTAAEGARRLTVEGVVELERLTLSSPPVEGIVLRYGHLYGPGTGANAAAAPALHVDAAAMAALLAVRRGRPGIYNIAEPGRYLDTAKAERELGFDANFRSGDS